MNRTGLLVALGILLLVGVIFGMFPRLDLAISAWFDDPAGPHFPARFVHVLSRIRSVSMWVVAGLVAPAAIALLLKLLLPYRRMLMPARAALFLLVTLALGPGLMVNVGLKDHWPRPRPIDVQEFGGPDRFVAWWDLTGTCPKNCSFVAGEGSGAFWTLAPAALVPAPWRAAAYGAALVFGSIVGGLRLASGGHFFTDVVFAGGLVFLLIWTVHGLLYRWRTHPSDDATERAVASVTLPLYRRLSALAARFSRRAP